MINRVAIKRDVYLDSAAGILLLHMILRHCFQFANMEEIYDKYTYYLGFFLPWFFFKSGQYFKSTSISKEYLKCYRRLLYPYIVFSLMGILLKWIFLFIEGHFTLKSLGSPIYSILRFGSPEGNLALWFLLSLMIVRLMGSIINQRINAAACVEGKWLIINILISFVGLFLQFIPNNIKIYIPFYILNIPLGYTFFWIGEYYRLKLLHQSSSNWIGLIALIIYSILMIYYPTIVDLRSATLVKGSWFLYYPTEILGIISLNYITLKVLNNRNIFSYIGRNSMPFYVEHWLILIFIKGVFVSLKLNDTSVQYLTALIAFNIILLPIITFLVRKGKLGYIFGE